MRVSALSIHYYYFKVLERQESVDSNVWSATAERENTTGILSRTQTLGRQHGQSGPEPTNRDRYALASHNQHVIA